MQEHSLDKAAGKISKDPKDIKQSIYSEKNNKSNFHDIPLFANYYEKPKFSELGLSDFCKYDVICRDFIQIHR
jgi:hypothetical protein